ncbi:hypothetical protein Tco_1246771 [Tanacetum coccineum]
MFERRNEGRFLSSRPISRLRLEGKGKTKGTSVQLLKPDVLPGTFGVTTIRRSDLECKDIGCGLRIHLCQSPKKCLVHTRERGYKYR